MLQIQKEFNLNETLDKAKVKNAAPPAKIAIQQSETTPPNMSKKKPHAIAAAKIQ